MQSHTWTGTPGALHANSSTGVPAPARATKGEKDPSGHLGVTHGTNARQADMSGHVRLTRQAGGAVVLDTRTWHAAFPNTGGRDRRSLTLRC